VFVKKKLYINYWLN